MVAKLPRQGRSKAQPAEDPAHAPGKRKLGPPANAGKAPHDPLTESHKHQPWVPTSGLVGRKRRSARRG